MKRCVHLIPSYLPLEHLKNYNMDQNILDVKKKFVVVVVVGCPCLRMFAAPFHQLASEFMVREQLDTVV